MKLSPLQIHEIVIELIEQIGMINDLTMALLNGIGGSVSETDIVIRIMSDEILIEEKLKSIGVRVRPDGAIVNGVTLGKIVGSDIYARKMDRVLGTLYYEKMGLEEFIREKENVKESHMLPS
jgi:hypothetical protein